MGNDPVESWKKQNQWYSDNDYFRELNRIDGHSVEFEWKIFPGFTLGILDEIQNMMTEIKCEPKQLQGRIILMSMFNDIVWDAKGNDELCVNNSKTIKENAGRFPRGLWSSWIRKEVARNLRWQTRWILESNCRENAAELRRIRSSDIPLHQCLGELRI